MWNRVLNERGFGMAELIVVVAIIGLLAALALPSFLTYWQSSTLSAGAAEMQSTLNRGRQLAIAQNGSVCVQVSGTGVRYRTASCAGTIWTGTGTNSAGLVSLSSGLEILGVVGRGSRRTRRRDGDLRFVTLFDGRFGARRSGQNDQHTTRQPAPHPWPV